MTRCPICKKMSEQPAISEPGGMFPFCSDRCKLRDLGRWLSDAYQIPIDHADDGDDKATPEVWIDPNVRNGKRHKES